LYYPHHSTFAYGQNLIYVVKIIDATGRFDSSAENKMKYAVEKCKLLYKRTKPVYSILQIGKDIARNDEV